MNGTWSSTITISPEMLRLIADIDAFRGRWEVLGAAAPNQLTSLRRAAIIESVASSTRIEGSALSNDEVNRLLSGLKRTSFISRDEQEVLGYADALQVIVDDPGAIPISEASIRHLHAILLAQSEKDQWHAGQYKTMPNSVAAFDERGRQIGIVFETSSPADTAMRMRELVDWTAREFREGTLHPLLIIGVFAVVFLEIHPFQDGNGRLSRLLTNLMLLQHGYTYVPYSSLESIVEESKEGYYRALRDTQGTIRTDAPRWEPWLVYFLRALHRQVTRLEFKLAHTPVFSGQATNLADRILSHLMTNGSSSIGELTLALGANRNTLKVSLRHLVAEGRLSRVGAGRGTRYVLAPRRS